MREMPLPQSEEMQDNAKNHYDFVGKIDGLTTSKSAEESISYFKEIVQDADFKSLGDEKRPYFITVNHIVPTLPVLLGAMSEIGDIVGIICKGDEKVRDKRIVKYVKERFTILQYKDANGIDCTKTELAKEIEACKLLRDWLSKITDNRPVILMDIGGYFAPALPAISQDEFLSKKITGIVEDTKNGEVKYQEVISRSKIPVYSVAESRLKKREDRFVGISIVHATDTILRKEANTPLSFEAKRVGVLGYGKIGKGIVYQLKKQEVQQLYVCEQDSSRRADTQYDGCKLVSFEELVTTSDMIFSATGAKVLGSEEFKKMKDGVYISSVTSATDEMKINDLESWQKEQTSKNITIYKNPDSKKEIRLLCGGNAVNFVFYGVNGPFIYAVQANMIYAARELLSSSGRVGEIAVLTPDVERRNEEIWVQYFAETARLIEERLEDRNSYPVFPKQKEVISNLPPKPVTYQDRNWLEKIEKEFSLKSQKQERKIQILAGLSGSGKTQLSYEIGRKSKHGAWIINAKSQESYEDSLNELCKKLKISQSSEIKSKVHDICEKLSESDFVLIIDDAPDREFVVDFFNETKTPNILITSQNQTWGGATVHSIKGYDDVEATKYIKKTLPDAHEFKVLELAKLLSCHPLALSHAVHCITADYKEIEEYVNDYNELIESRKEFLNKGPLEEDRNGYNKTVMSTFLLSLGKAKHRFPKAADVLEESVIYDASNLDFDIFEIPKSEIAKVKQTLTRYSLIDLPPSGMNRKFTVHDLVRDVISINLSDGKRLQDKINVVISRLGGLLRFNGDRSQKHCENRVLASKHVGRILELYESYELPRDTVVKFVGNYLNTFLFEKGQLDFSELLKLTKNLFKDKIPHDIAKEFIGKLSPELKKIKEEVTDYEKTVGPENLNTWYEKEKSRDLSRANKYYAIGQKLNNKKREISRIGDILIFINEGLLNHEDSKIVSKANQQIGEMLCIKTKYKEAVERFDKALSSEKNDLEKINICNKSLLLLQEAPASERKKIVQIKMDSVKRIYGKDSEKFKEVKEEFDKTNLNRAIYDFFPPKPSTASPSSNDVGAVAIGSTQQDVASSSNSSKRTFSDFASSQPSQSSDTTQSQEEDGGHGQSSNSRKRAMTQSDEDEPSSTLSPREGGAVTKQHSKRNR